MVDQSKNGVLARARRLAGRVRAALTSDGDAVAGQNAENLRQAQARVKERNQQLGRLREALAKKDAEISRLRDRVVRGGEPAPVFFIVGFAKSGTSWLMRTLNYHPEIYCTGEGIFFGRGPDLDKRRGAVVPSSLYGIFSNSEYLRAWLEKSAWTRNEDAEAHVDGLTHAAIDYFMRQRLVRSGKRIVGDKTPFVGEGILEEIKSVYPEAKILHIIRDGRDVAVSAIHHTWNHAVDAGGHITVKPEELATRDEYRRDPRAFLESGRGIFERERLERAFARPWYEMTSRAIAEGPSLFGDQYAEVRYEDLLERPAEEVGRLLSFLGADASEETVERCVEKASFESWSKGRVRGQEDSSSFLRKGVAGDWREVFVEEDKESFKGVAGDLLVRLGYEKGNDW